MRVRTAAFLSFLTQLSTTLPTHANPEVTAFSFSPTTRIGAQSGYFRHYVPSEGYAATMAFTGSVSACNPGTVSATFLNDCQRRINYYRTQTGLPSDIVFNATKNTKAQWAALIMARESNLSHQPAIDFPGNACVVADKSAHGGNGWGHEAAGSGNLSLGTYGPGAIDDYMIDSGAGNEATGHRRWLLNPSAQEMGMGSIPAQASYYESSCIWVIGNFKAASPATTKIVSWPNAGYVPYSIIPNPTNAASSGGQLRWSCSYTKGNFAAATVSVLRTSGAGSPVNVPVTKEAIETGYGDNTLVWKINSAASIVIPTPAEDIAYSVVISNITLTSGSPPPEFVSTGSGSYRYSYSVTTFDKNYLPTAMTVTGPTSAAVGLNNPYAVNQLPESSGLRVRAGSLAASAWTEGAEDPSAAIIDGTSTSTPYTLRLAAGGTLVAAGTKAFHLAFPTLNDALQSFTISRDFVPSATSHLQFKNRFRFVTLASYLNAEVSIDGGGTWKEIWRRTGDANSNSGNSANLESAYQTVDSATALTPFVGKVVRLRFTYNYPASSSIFTGTTSFFGAFVDAITVTNAQDLTTVSTTDLPNGTTTYNFTPPSAGTYALQSQMAMGGNHLFDYGPFTTVTAATATAQQTWRNTQFGAATNSGNAADTADGDRDGLANVIEYAFGLNPTSPQPTSADLPKATRSGNNLLFTFKPNPAATGLTYIVQKSTTLGAWTPTPAVLASGVYTATVPISGPRLILRLQVTNPTGL